MCLVFQTALVFLEVLLSSAARWGIPHRLLWSDRSIPLCQTTTLHWGQLSLRLECIWPHCAQQISAIVAIINKLGWLFCRRKASVFIPIGRIRFIAHIRTDRKFFSRCVVLARALWKVSTCREVLAVEIDTAKPCSSTKSEDLKKSWQSALTLWLLASIVLGVIINRVCFKAFQFLRSVQLSCGLLLNQLAK